MTHSITCPEGTSKIIADMATYFNDVFGDLFEADKLVGEEREAAFIAIAHQKYQLMSEQEAKDLSRGVDCA